MLSFVSAVAPGLTDRLMVRLLLPATHSGRPRNPRPNLDTPSEDLRERGDYRGMARPSLYTALVRHPTAAGLAALVATFALSQVRTAVERRSRAEASPIDAFLRSIKPEQEGAA